MYLRNDISKATTLIELLYWGANNPPNIGVVTLWLQQIELLALLSRLLGKEGLVNLIYNLAEHSTSPTTQYNIRNHAVNDLLGWLEIEIEYMEPREELTTVVLADETILYVPLGTSIEFMNKFVPKYND